MSSNQETYLLTVVEREGEKLFLVGELLVDELGDLACVGWDARFRLLRDRQEILYSSVYEYGTHGASPVIDDPSNIFGQGRGPVDRIRAEWLQVDDTLLILGDALPHGLEDVLKRSFLFLRGMERAFAKKTSIPGSEFVASVNEGVKEYIEEGGREVVLGPILRFARKG